MVPPVSGDRRCVSDLDRHSVVGALLIVTVMSAGRGFLGKAGNARLILVTAMILGAALGSPHHGGTAMSYVLFHGACVLLLLAAFLPPVSYGFTALSIFLLLGFWVKSVGALLGLPVLIEPIGDFTMSVEVIDRTLLFGAAGLTGVAVPRIAWYVVSTTDKPEPDCAWVPVWYAAGRGIVWAVTLAAVAGGAYLNWRYRFYVIGVRELLVLPSPLNAGLAWWYTAGSTLWIAALLDWERRLRAQRSFAPLLIIPIAEAAITTTVMLSRGFFLVKMLPYVLALLRPRIRRRLHLRPAITASLLALTALSFAVSLAGVSWLRMLTYPVVALSPSSTVAPGHSSVDAPEGAVQTARRVPGAPAASPSPIDVSAQMEARVRELGGMILGRWIGLEGVMAVAASADLSPDLLRAGLMENPGLGVDALYQQLSGGKYKALSEFTFLTVPGSIAVMAYSGSYLIIFVGMGIVSSVLLATERWIRRLFANDFLCAVAGVAMANVIAQMNFPYLTLVFFVELVVTVAALWLLSVFKMRSPRDSAVGQIWDRRQTKVEARGQRRLPGEAHLKG